MARRVFDSRTFRAERRGLVVGIPDLVVFVFYTTD